MTLMFPGIVTTFGVMGALDSNAPDDLTSRSLSLPTEMSPGLMPEFSSLVGIQTIRLLLSKTQIKLCHCGILHNWFNPNVMSKQISPAVKGMHYLLQIAL